MQRRIAAHSHKLLLDALYYFHVLVRILTKVKKKMPYLKRLKERYECRKSYREQSLNLYRRSYFSSLLRDNILGDPKIIGMRVIYNFRCGTRYWTFMKPRVIFPDKFHPGNGWLVSTLLLIPRIINILRAIRRDNC